MRLRFSGHDTFPLRYGWLYKAVNLLINKENTEKKADEIAKQAIVDLGVGRNMINAIKYWADVTGVTKTVYKNGRPALEISELGRLIFDQSAGPQSGADPFLEDIGSIWLIHFYLNFNSESLTSCRYFFNHCNFQKFEKIRFVDEVYNAAPTLTGADAGKKTTLKKDVDCFLHTYTKKFKANNRFDEEQFSSPLSELGLMKEFSNGNYVSEFTERKTLPSEIFSYALCRFLLRRNQESKSGTLSFDSLLSDPGSPGRIFRLSESGLTNKLDEASENTKGKISWTDTSGLRQITISEELLKDKNYKDFIENYYGNGFAFYE